MIKKSLSGFTRTNFSQNLRGFTLVELLLYVAIVSVLILSTSAVYIVLLQSRVKNQVIAEVEQQGQMVMSTMLQAIRNGDLIATPPISTSNTSLTFTSLDVAKNPTVFDLSAGAIRINEASTSAIALTSTKVTASALTFQNISYSGTPGTVKIQFTLTSVNNSGRNEYDYSKTFTSDASLR